MARKVKNFWCPAILSTLCPHPLRRRWNLRKISTVNERHQLGQLIETVQKQNEWSDRDLQNRADRLGLEMSKSNFSRIKNAEVKSVKGSFIRDLAEVLGVPQRVVSDAALASMGVDVERSSGRAEDAIEQDVTIAGHDRRLALALISAMRQEASERHDRQDEAEPGPEARREEHSSQSSSEDGSTPQRSGAPIGDDLEQQRKKKRIADDPAAFGDQARRGDLDQGKLQPPPPAEQSAAWRTENRGKKLRQDQDRHAED